MKRISLLLCAAMFGFQILPAQHTKETWTLQKCIDYALEHNISLQQSRNDYQSGLEDTKEAKAARLPSLSASATQGFTNYPSSDVANRNGDCHEHRGGLQGTARQGGADVEGGAISKVDFARLESQWASDRYQVVVSRATADDCRLRLKQLLELDIPEKMELSAPQGGEEEVLRLLPCPFRQESVPVMSRERESGRGLRSGTVSMRT